MEFGNIAAADELQSNEGNTQSTSYPTFSSLTKRLSRRLSFSRLRGNSVEGTESSARRQRNSEKRKSWSGFRLRSKTEDTDQVVVRRQSTTTQSRRSSWYEKFRRVLDYKPNEENTASSRPSRPPPREPFSFPLTEAEFQLLQREPRFVDRSQEYKMEYFLVPDLLAVTKCPWYWGKINRYEAEKVIIGRKRNCCVCGISLGLEAYSFL